MVLHAKHACGVSSTRKYRRFGILLIGHANNLDKFCVQKRKGSTHRIAAISEVANYLQRQLAEGVTKQEACEATIGLHAPEDVLKLHAAVLRERLKWTEMCTLKCDNMTSEDDEIVLRSDSDDEDDE